MELELLKILCCPETHQGLRVAESGMVDRLNREIDAGTLKNRGGQLVTEKFEGGLVRDDGKMMYLIRRRIPVMLVEEAILLG
jgi:uncharacterized protein YbaR (Trm112 family)